MQQMLNKKLTVLQQVIIDIAKQEGKVTPKRVMMRYNITYRKLQDNFYKLEEEGLISRTHDWKLEFRAM